MIAPPLRVRPVLERPVRPGRHVLYWMTAARRLSHSFALDHAIARATELGLPLVIFEPLRLDYAWASERHHAFVIDGMREHRARSAGAPWQYVPYVEPVRGAGKGLLAALAQDAALVVADDFPAFFLPAMLRAAAAHLDVRIEAVDSNGLYPMRATTRVFERAMDFRRHLQRELPTHLLTVPSAEPLQLASKLPKPQEISATTRTRWLDASDAVLEDPDRALTALALDHTVRRTPTRGGTEAARATLRTFLETKLARYGERNEPDLDLGSGLSPYLHFGHLSVHEVWASLCARERWSLEDVAPKPNGVVHGFWRMSDAAESFIDELVTWRELGLNFCSKRPDFDQYESLPTWAKATLAAHAQDPRPTVYDAAAFEQARTHDPLWNAAQRQLVEEGRIHNYLRMLWGKKILEWSKTPQDALRTMIELNNKYALDGRDPNSYSGIFWVLGRYDRPWPERAIYGTIRSMSSDNTRRKVSVEAYLARYGGGQRNLFR